MSADNNPRKRYIYFGDGLLTALKDRPPTGDSNPPVLAAT
jgi:hypothetical protein